MNHHPVRKIVTSSVFVAASLAAIGVAPAYATTAVIDGITVTESGRVNPASPNFGQPASVDTTGVAQIQIGQVAGPGNPPEFSNSGWNPYGLDDVSHNWWNVYSGSVTFNLSGSRLNVVWGSPNDDDPTSSNSVSFYSGANGTGSLLGTVLASDLYSNFAGIANTTDPGYLVSFAPGKFGSVVFGTVPSDFEFAVVGVPEPSTWAMLLLGFAGLGYAGFRKPKGARAAFSAA